MKYLLISILSFCLCSCVSIKRAYYTKHYYDYDYKGEPNFEDFYVVDTIEIKDPLIIFTKDNPPGVMLVSNEYLDEVKGKSFGDILNHPFVYLFSENFFHQFEEIDENIYLRYSYDERKCGRINYSEFENFDIEELSNGTGKFVLGLININWFNRNNVGDAQRPIHNKWHKASYLKIVFPLCE